MTAQTSARQSQEYYDRERPKLIAWLAMTKDERAMLGEPNNQRAWANLHGVSERWVNKIAREAVDEVEDLRIRKVVQSGGELGKRDARELEGLSNAELLADILRRNLMAAAAGDKSGLDFLRSNPSLLKPIIDAIHSDFVSDFDDLEDSELVAKFLGSFEAECVLGLRELGWTVERADA
jgi:hypothetical protein